MKGINTKILKIIHSMGIIKETRNKWLAKDEEKGTHTLLGVGM